MNIDVLYRVRKDLAWQYLKSYVRPSSMDLVVYRACLDKDIIKMTIYKAIGTVKPDGYFFVCCPTTSVGIVVSLLEKKGYNYKEVVLHNDPGFLIGIIAYKSKVYAPRVQTIVRISSMNDIADFLIQLSNFRDKVLLIGDYATAMGVRFKKMSRYIIAFGSDELICTLLKSESVHEEEI